MIEIIIRDKQTGLTRTPLATTELSLDELEAVLVKAGCKKAGEQEGRKNGYE